MQFDWLRIRVRERTHRCVEGFLIPKVLAKTPQPSEIPVVDRERSLGATDKAERCPIRGSMFYGDDFYGILFHVRTAIARSGASWMAEFGKLTKVKPSSRGGEGKKQSETLV
ncbi:caytaxin [Anopheles sinensis]|uniref:Caytaxin n=1 Tax=Anopheles sinensis TaxID=74873 RepID=A0A084WHK4_ANOSI|nr:caytaxin [Anopheles sinensis]